MRKLIVLALLLSGCSSYMTTVYGDSPANADYTACLKANPTSWPKFHACMAEAGLGAGPELARVLAEQLSQNIGDSLSLEEPHPLNERQALEHELREELPAQLAAYRQELENGRPSKARRDRLEWQNGEREKRLAEVEARLAKVSAESGPQPQCER